ncbi:MAG: hypothetical protein PVJ57_09980 [Phycisphaerae bacterium]|jgi:hypothetical protein
MGSSITTPTEVMDSMVYVALVGVVVGNLVIAAAAVGSIVWLAAMRGFRWRFLWYSYELFFATLCVLHAHSHGRIIDVHTIVGQLYWASLFACWPLLLAPFFAERDALAEAGWGRFPKATPAGILMFFLLVAIAEAAVALFSLRQWISNTAQLEEMISGGG